MFEGGEVLADFRDGMIPPVIKFGCARLQAAIAATAAWELGCSHDRGVDRHRRAFRRDRTLLTVASLGLATLQHRKLKVFRQKILHLQHAATGMGIPQHT
jgi:hypothetical protein